MYIQPMRTHAWASAVPFVALVALGCASSMAPAPFSAAMIRDATPAGSVYLFETTDATGNKRLQRIEFADVDAAGCAIVVRPMTADREPIDPPIRRRATWDELKSHASYPAARTKVTETQVVVPAGTFDAWLYTVTEDNGRSVTRAYFAKKLPGAPVKHEIERDGKLVSRSVLVEHRNPSPRSAGRARSSVSG